MTNPKIQTNAGEIDEILIDEILGVHDVYYVKFVPLTEEEWENKNALDLAFKTELCSPDDPDAKAITVLHDPNWTEEDELILQASMEAWDLD